MLLAVLVRNSTSATPPATVDWANYERNPEFGCLGRVNLAFCPRPVYSQAVAFVRFYINTGLPGALDSPIRWINYACAAKHSIRLIQLAIPQRWKVWPDYIVLHSH